MLRNGQVDKGMGLLSQAGELGETRAMMELGYIYWEGRDGQDKDELEALRWFEKAAYAGDWGGMLNLAVFCDLGIGAPEDPESAARWYREAAVRGSSDAAYNLGAMYEDGRGVPRDPVTACEFYRRAARKGNAEAVKRFAKLCNR